MVAGTPCMCMSTTPAPVSAATRAIAGIAAQRRDVVDDRRARLERLPRDLGLGRVDRDRDRDLGRQRLDDRDRRAAALRRARPASAPGRLDSPPRSSRSAPSATSASACRTASSASKRRPPSEKLSGVTLTMPITSGTGSSAATIVRATGFPSHGASPLDHRLHSARRRRRFTDRIASAPCQESPELI